jgi:aminoglycoside phosphotransferase (APT) family kinase protein
MTTDTTDAMIANMRDAFQRVLTDLLGREVAVSEPLLLAGGASKEAWAVDADGEPLLVRRAAVGVIHRHTLPLAHEFAVIEAAYEAGVKVPRPYGYVPDLAGREAFVMERLEGEAIGRRIVRKPELEAARAALPSQLAEELAKIHAIPVERVPFLSESQFEGIAVELDEVGEPHPAIELGLLWLRENRPPPREPALAHGDYRIGNVMVDERGLVGVLDWEFAHLDDPARDLAFGMVRQWRFGMDHLRFGGISAAEPYVERYNELTGRDVRPEELDYWELAGNVGWAIACLTQAQRHLSGQDRSVEFAILGRLGAEVEYEICHLLERVS